MNKPVSLIDREIEAKIDAALQAEIAKGKQLSDMGVRDFRGIADNLHTKVSPAARDELIRQGLEHMVKFVLGSMIAEVVWKDGTGWPATDEQILSVSAPLLSVTGSNANWAVEATIPNQPRIAWARVEKNVAGAGWVTHSTHDVRPGETIETTVTDTVSSGETIEIRAFCFTSNDTVSASNLFSHTEA